MPRRRVLKFLGFSAVNALFAVGCQGASQQGQVDSQPLPDIESDAVSIPSLEILEFKTAQVNAQGQIISELTEQGQYFDEPYLVGKLNDTLPLRMMRIPAGQFVMGSPKSEEGRDNVYYAEEPQHLVVVPEFFIGAFAITQQQYQEIMGDNPSFFDLHETHRPDAPNRPVDSVSWVQADLFCQKLSELTGRRYRLPSEAEWEYACRAGTTTPFYFGETLTSDLAHYDSHHAYGSGSTRTEGYRRETKIADSFMANAFGLYNMHGNVYEWCADDVHQNYAGAPENADVWLSGNDDGQKIMRGGSYPLKPQHCRSAFRASSARTTTQAMIGFRVVVSV